MSRFWLRLFSGHSHRPVVNRLLSLTFTHPLANLPRPFLLSCPRFGITDLDSLSTSQHNPAAVDQPAMKEEESHSEEFREQLPSHPPAPKVKMTLHDFALRKKKQREEETTKNVHDTPSAAGVNLSFDGSEGGRGPNGIHVNPMGQVDGEESCNWKAVEVKEDFVDSYQGASTLSRNVVKNEVVGVAGTSSINPTSSINFIYLPQPSSSPPPDPLSTLLVACIQADTSATYPLAACQFKQEPIEEPIHTAVTIQPRTMDSRHYTGMYNHSGSILPINSDPHHFQSYSPSQSCQEDGEIGEILDTPPRLPSSLLPSLLPPAPPSMNRL
jgi:hypothetical protein